MRSTAFNLILCVLVSLPIFSFAQMHRPLQFYREPGKMGLNVFETPKDEGYAYDGFRIRVGGDFALQFQGLSQENSGDSLVELSNNFTLPTANLNFDVQLADGMRLHLRTYLSSRHHPEAWVKGGYLQMDKLDFISEGFLEGLMDVLTIRVGMDQINYGDTHFRRSDNAMAIYNPFVGNYIMDAFTTEPFIEFTIQSGGFLAVAGATNGRLNQSPNPGDDGFVFYGKLGYDQQLSELVRFRLTGSLYTSSSKGTRDYIYNGDRAGARYYDVMHGINTGGSDFLPRFNPGFPYHTAFQINPFLKFSGLEIFGVLEFTNNGQDAGGNYTQLGGEALYRFGGTEQFYVGGRYNNVSGKANDNANEISISRVNLGGGWFMTNNVLAKFEYVNQNYDGDGYSGSKFQGAKFNGVVIEAVISF